MIVNEIFRNLPFDLIREILIFDKRFVIRKPNNNLIFINNIPKIVMNNYSSLFKNIFKITEFTSNSWSVSILRKNKKFIIQHYLQPNLVWEYRFLTFTKDPHTNIINNIPDSVIYIPSE
jgi:hypothetical protein